MSDPKPKAVVFDLGKVLLDFDYARAARNLLPHCSVSGEELAAALDQSALLLRYEAGTIGTGEFFGEVKKISGFRLGLDQFAPLFGDIFSPIPETIALNGRLRAAGVPTYIFSNTNELAIAHIRAAYPFFANFTGYVFSWEQRAMKPDPAIYGAVENLSGCRGPELLYLDDRFENVAQGAARGWQTIHHADAAATIARVEELLR